MASSLSLRDGIIQIYVTKRLWPGTLEDQSVKSGWQPLWKGAEGLEHSQKDHSAWVCPSELWKAGATDSWRSCLEIPRVLRKPRKDQTEEALFLADLPFHLPPPIKFAYWLICGHTHGQVNVQSDGVWKLLTCYYILLWGEAMNFSSRKSSWVGSQLSKLQQRFILLPV